MFISLLCLPAAAARLCSLRHELAAAQRSAALGFALDAATRAYAELLSALSDLARARQRPTEGASAEDVTAVLYCDLALATATATALEARRALAELVRAARPLQKDVAILASDSERFADALEARLSAGEAGKERRKAEFMFELSREAGRQRQKAEFLFELSRRLAAVCGTVGTPGGAQELLAMSENDRPERAESARGNGANARDADTSADRHGAK